MLSYGIALSSKDSAPLSTARPESCGEKWLFAQVTLVRQAARVKYAGNKFGRQARTRKARTMCIHAGAIFRFFQNCH